LRSLLRRLKPSALPVAIGGSILLICWFYLIWNTTIGEAIPALRFRTKDTIAGIVGEAAPTMTLESVLKGSYQESVSRGIGVLSPMFKPALNWKGQFYYSLLGMSPTDVVDEGPDKQLVQSGYIDEYCSRNIAQLVPKAEDWAVRLRKLQDFFEARGQMFLYVITPSKPARYPDVIPVGYPCPAPASDRARKLEVYDRILARHGVKFVDTIPAMKDAEARYGVRVFPRGGIHWNDLGSALGAQMVIEGINRERGAPLLSPLNFTVGISYDPQGTDRDLLDLMNLRFSDQHYPVPRLTYYPVPLAGGCRTITIGQVGGSFLWKLNDALDEISCPPKITHWFYWDRMRRDYPGGSAKGPPIDAEARRRSLLDADLVMLEENEAAGPVSGHGKEMMEAISKLGTGLEAAQ